MRNHSLLLLKVIGIGFVLIAMLLTSCASTHSGCVGVCSNKGKSIGKYYGLSKNSNPKNWKR
jgi:hypothetical protein